MRHAPIEFRPFDGPSGAQLRSQWEALHDKADTLWRQESRVVSQGTIAEAQRAYCQDSAQARAEAWLASLHDGTEDGKHAPARLLSCACHPASAWLDTLPLLRDLELKTRPSVPDCPPTSPRLDHPAPRCPHHAVRLWSHPAPLGHRPWHAMPRPRCTVYAAP
jgi:hypothetical protein